MIPVLQAVFKAAPEQQVTIGLVYPAFAKDGHGEYMTADELEHTAHHFLAKYRSVGLFHADGTEGHGTVVESWIHRGPDWVVKAIDGLEYTIHAGDWCAAVQWDAVGWSVIKAGYADGFSFQGRARKRPRSAAHIVR